MDDSGNRCNVHSENKFVFAQEIETYVLTVFYVWW